MLGLIGTFNSGCAAIIIPVLNQAPGGALAMISPANTFVCLTQAAPACSPDEPDEYYPTGDRNYARVVANDAYQGAAMAEFMQEQGVTKLFILQDEQSYGLGVASNTRDAAEFLGIEIVGFEAWDAKASNYEALMNQVKESGADALFLGGLIDENGAQLIKDKVKVLGPNDGDVQLFMPDGFYDAVDDRRVGCREHARRLLLGRRSPDRRVRVRGGPGVHHDLPGDARRRARRPVRDLRGAGRRRSSWTRSRPRTEPGRA